VVLSAMDRLSAGVHHARPQIKTKCADFLKAKPAIHRETHLASLLWRAPIG